ncbi:hypothetical protein Q8O96_10950 [Pseudomonas sp. LPH60]|uniref:hypothetical protein n=1 Tax=Pseudomonas sp. LPH60 TaxID=3065906 RepID=UPI00273AA201|nr:hypothetical protein [Pseudomonas sp. LPH60]MDP4569564.1 hypothetical protein [Pseudomonas sp. LPH60]
MPTEAIIHQEIEKIIREGGLLERIDEADIKRIEDIIVVDPNLLPAFSIDEYVRKRFAESASATLSSLNILEVLTSDNNISLTKNETLRPDIVCINSETQQLVIFEFKKSNQTGRQALTELLAYEHEVKNLLPFLSNYDTTFVLISTEWSVLLEHAATSAITWSNKNLLCLQVDTTPGDYKFKIHSPSSWSITGTPNFPSDSVSSFTISFEAPPSMDADEITNRLYLAMSFLAREAERMGLHGFALLSKNLGGYCDDLHEIILCSTSPLAFFDTMLRKGKADIENGHLTAKIAKFTKRHGTESGLSSLLELSTKVIEPRLEAFKNFELGRFVDWNTTRKLLQESGLPILTEFWGLPGDYARSYISNPAVQNARPTLFPAGLSDWREPFIGLWLIRNLFEPQFCSEGFIRPSDTFRLGLSIGRHFFLTKIASESAEPMKFWDALMFWNFSSLTCYIDELFILARTANDINPPKSQLTLSAYTKNSFDPTELNEWIESEILDGIPFHLTTFHLGLELGPAMLAEDLETSIFVNALKDQELITNFSGYLAAVLKKADKEPAYNESHKRKHLSNIEKILNLDDISSHIDSLDLYKLSLADLCKLTPDVLVLADLVIPAVTHTYDQLPPIAVDWDNLKRGIDGMYKQGKRYPALYIHANGSIGTASYDDNIYTTYMMPITDTEKEVYLMDASHGVEMFRIVKWADVRSGQVIPIPQ